MKKITPFLFRQYAKMPGGKKIRLGMELSDLARIVNKQGLIHTNIIQANAGNKPTATA